MTDIQRNINDKIDKFRKLYEHTQGGIFTQKTREKLLTKKGISERGQQVNTFWYRQRENVKTALIDLQLFIETANRNNVNQVMTKETLRPIIRALLTVESDLYRAEICKLLITTAFSYLESKQIKNITLSHQRTITEALDLCGYLVEAFKPESERYQRVLPMRSI